MFQILRYFSITSIFVIGIVAMATLVLFEFYRDLTVTELIELEEGRNVALTQAFANSIWPRFASYVTSASTTDGDELRARPETAQIREAVVALMQGLPVVKIKIYNLDGLTVFSTDPSEIGVRHATNEGFFAAARAGQVMSDVTRRGKINAFDGELQNREILESYIPVRRGAGPVEAVFELYSDVTDLRQRIEQVQKNLLFGLIAAFSLIYGGLFLIVWRGNVILKRQNADLLRAREDIKEKNEELNHEIAERKQAQASILENERRIRRIVENVADGIATIDDHGIIESVNPAVERLFGYTAEELIGENVSILMSEPERGQHDGHIRNYTATGKGKILGIGPREVTGRRKDGSTIEIDLAVTEMALEDKHIFIGTMRDAAAHKQAEAILRAAKQEAERANYAKSRFFAVASHDLRQPLHAMSLFLPLLAKRVTTPKTQEIVDAIAESCDAMKGLLDALLDISKLDAGVIRPEVESVGTGTLIQKLETEFGPQAREKGLELRVVPVDLRVMTDPVLIGRILRNLLSNAVQHTPQGRVLFGARRRGRYLRFEVWDTGVGIADDHREEIFQEFYQIGSPERDRSRGLGLGLGLAVVHRLSVLLGHRVEVRSVPGKGSLFAVEVPMIQEPEDDETEVCSAAREPNSDMAGVLVVVIEDEAEVLTGTRMNLEDWGCRVIAADTVDAALAKIAESDRRPDAILMDYHLHGEEMGPMAIKRIHRFIGTPIPAIIVTGDTAPWRIREAAENGYALVHKPVRPEKLRALLQAELSGARQRARAEVV